MVSYYPLALCLHLEAWSVVVCCVLRVVCMCCVVCCVLCCVVCCVLCVVLCVACMCMWTQLLSVAYYHYVRFAVSVYMGTCEVACMHVVGLTH